jgi:hypothetical protein
MKGKKIDIEDRVAIWVAKLNNPNLSSRDIAGELNTSKSTVARVIEEDLGQIGTTELWKTLYETNLEIINIGVEKVRIAMLKLDPENIRDAKEMQSIVEVSFKQNQLIRGKATERTETEIIIKL